MKRIFHALAIAVALLSFSCSEKIELLGSGSFEATEVTLSSQTTGEILTMGAREGDLVEKGELLSQIDSIQLELKRDQLLATIAAAENRRPDLPSQLAPLEQQLATAYAEQKRIENLFQAGAANEKQFDDMEAQISLIEKQRDQLSITLTRNDKALTEEITALNQQVYQIDDQLHRCRLTAPLTGRVIARYAEEGELAQPGKALYKIADLDRIYLRAYITQNYLAQLKLGQKVQVITDSSADGGRSYGGTITQIASEAEFTPKTVQTQDERANLVYAVKVAVENDGYLRIGMYGGVRLPHE